MMQGFIFRSASTSVKKTHEYVSIENRGREKAGQMDQRERRRQSHQKGGHAEWMRGGWTCRAAADHQLLPLCGDTHLSVRVFYCGVVLLHKDPLNKLNRLWEEHRDNKPVDIGSYQRMNKMAQREKHVALLDGPSGLFNSFYKRTSHVHTNKTSGWGLCYTAGSQSSPDEVLRSKYVSLPGLGGLTWLRQLVRVNFGGRHTNSSGPPRAQN